MITDSREVVRLMEYLWTEGLTDFMNEHRSKNVSAREFHLMELYSTFVTYLSNENIYYNHIQKQIYGRRRKEKKDA